MYKRYDVMYYDKEYGDDILWLRTPSFIDMVRAVIHLMCTNECVTVRIHNTKKYIENIRRN